MLRSRVLNAGLINETKGTLLKSIKAMQGSTFTMQGPGAFLAPVLENAFQHCCYKDCTPPTAFQTLPQRSELCIYLQRCCSV